ncbi:MAG TPA: LysR substrate-binding domain-containing protein, partial [Candidatus Methylomirabilis sp.]|nr:LysR substrate-binding domain-containing protein [Candidatus Methylomirabilis sp.]
QLIQGPWILAPPDTWNYAVLLAAFRALRLDMPKASVVTLCMPVITDFLANGPLITALPRSVVRFNSLQELPVDLPLRPWPVVILTMKNRTLSPVVERFVECACEVTKSMSERW